MSLCDLCKSIPLGKLPPFRDEEFIKTMSGKPRYHRLLLHEYEAGKPIERFGIQYHSDLESLRRAASEGCVLCQLVEKEASGLLEEISNLLRELEGALTCRPSWDMWLTRRGEPGGDGFWVVCGSTVESDRWVMPVASIGFASDENDDHSVGYNGRVLREIPDKTTLNRIVNWLKKCDEHPHCRIQGARMPTRLLDVGTSDSDHIIKLVEPDSGICSHYITLSYCWGKGIKHFTTTSETMQARKNGIKVDELPKTFQDAVFLTRMLGSRYLWIDSLCICQDDLKDWERESAQMAAVYSNSYLTLAAAKSDNANGGLLSARTPKTYVKLPCSSSSNGDYILASALPLDKEVIHNYHVQMREEPLTTRAWSLQERVLARRVLHFASNQMYWECLEGFEAEEGLKLPYSLPSISEDPQISAYVENQAKRKTKKSPKAVELSNPSMSNWNSLLWEYGPREMTNPADKLPAISGIARALNKTLDDEYLAGLWRGSLLEGLCWEPLSCEASDTYRAPSWSWASVDGIPATGFIGDVEEVAKVLEARVAVDGDNPFGRVKDGFIKLEAPLVRVKLSENKGPTGHVLFRSQKGDDDCPAMLDSIDRRYEVSAELIKSMEIYALVLVYTYGGLQPPDPERKNPCVHGIFVTPALDRPGCMRRIGAVLQDAKAFGPDEITACKKTVTVV
ncbi:heterokaryon incompatibility protein [Colletotrichum truncatum]|uniref:Heterokaryon incompatibility protein n=1 Tax=Colletotrichum truncatum TaxID=5467 RepID=A0ACC3YRP4_COLTU|nr:heterokaryon incompatibility protein [Colletotrichum truncatum]KAF6799301.1 heterokaryon incompatibility protein [Colletotrichum truncatum]